MNIFYYLLVLLLLFLYIFLPILAIFLLIAFLTGAPFVPTKKEVITEMIKMARIKKGVKAVDLGAGDGRLVIAMAQYGAQAYGYEINPFLVLWSKIKARKAGVSTKASFCFGSLWNADTSSFDVVFVYGIPRMMKKLEEKLQKELKPGATVVSNIFKFPDWKPVSQKNGIYLYKRELSPNVMNP